MQFKKNAEVITSDGEKLGTIDRVVIDPDSNDVTHLVVSKGFLLTTDKVLPIELVSYSTEERVVLKEGVADFEDLPHFEQSYYVRVESGEPIQPVEETFVPSLYWYPPMGTRWDLGVETGYDQPQYKIQTEKNIPEGTVALQEGAEVLSRDEVTVGDIERVITDNDHVTHIVIAEGLFLKEKKLIPVGWISMVLPDRIHLSVDADFIELLPEFAK